jgi:hypothetical protein
LIYSQDDHFIDVMDVRYQKLLHHIDVVQLVGSMPEHVMIDAKTGTKMIFSFEDAVHVFDLIKSKLIFKMANSAILPDKNGTYKIIASNILDDVVAVKYTLLLQNRPSEHCYAVWRCQAKPNPRKPPQWIAYKHFKQSAIQAQPHYNPSLQPLRLRDGSVVLHTWIFIDDWLEFPDWSRRRILRFASDGSDPEVLMDVQSDVYSIQYSPQRGEITCLQSESKNSDRYFVYNWEDGRLKHSQPVDETKIKIQLSKLESSGTLPDHHLGLSMHQDDISKLYFVGNKKKDGRGCDMIAVYEAEGVDPIRMCPDWALLRPGRIAVFRFGQTFKMNVYKY